MPEILTAIIPLLFGGIGAATQLHGLFSHPSAPSTPSGPPAPTGPSQDALKTALLGQAPTVQAQTGGGLSPEARLRMMEILAGLSGQPGVGQAGQSILNVIAGSGGGGGAGGLT